MGKKGKRASAAAAEQNDADDDLSEEHTIADSFSVNVSLFGGDFDDSDQEVDTDALIQRGDPGTADAMAAAEARLQSLQDALSLLSEFGQEKRTAKREAILRRVFKSVTTLAVTADGWEAVADAASTSILQACKLSLRPGLGSASEQYAACRVLECVSVVLGADEHDWVDRLDKVLRRTVERSRVTAVRCAALRALSMAVTVCAASDSVTAESLQDFVEAYAISTLADADTGSTRTTVVKSSLPTPPALQAAALDSWALLATLSDDWHVAGQDDVQTGRGLGLLQSLKDHLDGPDRELRSAAGMCLSLVHEARLNLGVSELESENATARRYQRGSWEGSQFEVLMDEVKQRVAELSVESGHHLSRKAKKEQRATFREYMATIVDDDAPEEVISFRSNGSLTLSTWKEIIQLQQVRHCLQGGFQIQLFTNPTLVSMFGADGLNSAGAGYNTLSQVEKRLIMSKTSDAYKVADQNRRGKRDKRENIKNHFLTADGEDI